MWNGVYLPTLTIQFQLQTPQSCLIDETLEEPCTTTPTSQAAEEVGSWESPQLNRDSLFGHLSTPEFEFND